MRIKILGILAAVALVGACETASDQSGKSSSSGAATKAATSSAPAAKAAGGIMKGSQQDLVVNVGDRVHFGFDQYSLSAEARAALDKQAAWFKSNPSVTATVEGHCDERGTRDYNLALGERRANAVKDYLAASGVNPARIKTISYGKERPVANGSNEDAWAQNRRSVTTVGSAGS